MGPLDYIFLALILTVLCELADTACEKLLKWFWMIPYKRLQCFFVPWFSVFSEQT